MGEEGGFDPNRYAEVITVDPKVFPDLLNNLKEYTEKYLIYRRALVDLYDDCSFADDEGTVVQEWAEVPRDVRDDTVRLLDMVHAMSRAIRNLLRVAVNIEGGAQASGLDPLSTVELNVRINELYVNYVHAHQAADDLIEFLDTIGAIPHLNARLISPIRSTCKKD